MLQLPPTRSHPVLIARKLLLLATFLQAIPSLPTMKLDDLSIDPVEMMSRAVMTAHELVICNDELVASVEGIECIMLESLYENYRGQLRRAWLAARRATMIAQVLGLHRGTKPVSVSGIDSNSDQVWFQLVRLDRYLSLILGLPQSSFEDSFATVEALETCKEVERMQRLTCVAGGRILRRSFTEMYSSKVTDEIDDLLQEASTSMLPQWWLMPTLTATTGYMQTVNETLRFMDQFTHYHLLLQLHLPYLLSTSAERKHIYSKMTAISASREVLSRYVAFRTYHATGNYCRGVDFLAFISSTALCIAHINQSLSTTKGDDTLAFLKHQRRSDRGMMERALEITQGQVDLQDAVSIKLATLLQHLLAKEADAAAGAEYSVGTEVADEANGCLGCDVAQSDDGNVLKVYLPNFWTITIKRENFTVDSRPLTNVQGFETSPLHSSASNIPQSQDRGRWQEATGGHEREEFSMNLEWHSQFLHESHPLNSEGTIDNASGSRVQDVQALRGVSDRSTRTFDWGFEDINTGIFDNLV